MGDDVNRMLEYGRVFDTVSGPGKRFFPNPRGLFDMLGNAWEICWDQTYKEYVGGLYINDNLTFAEVEELKTFQAEADAVLAQPPGPVKELRR